MNGTCTWRGTNPEGGARQGRSRYDAGSIASITEAYYRQGWRDLTVWLGWDPRGDEVAWIRTDPVDGTRTWWAEAAVRTQLEER